MLPTRSGTIRLFTAFGVSTHLHWTWGLLLLYFLQVNRHESSPLGNLLTFVTIFGIVLMHEYGHALACRSVGGRSEHIVLWPLGGVAYVEPPNRPGAHLWSIAAGPLVNVVLVPVTLAAHLLVSGWATAPASLEAFAHWVMVFNLVILCFNLLPIYPLDGGQILRSLLWFVIGPVHSLRITAGMGLFFALLGGGLALSFGHYWLVLLAGFAGLQAWQGWQVAQAMARMQRGAG